MRLLEVASPDRWGSLSSIRTISPTFVLTFDDGPTPERTPQVMAALREHSATATFFVLMRNARANHGLMASLLAEGHEIGLHGADHRRLRKVPPAELARLLRESRAELEDIIQRPIRWYRPPYGEQTLDAWRIVNALGVTSVLWSRTAWDWKHTDAATRLRVAGMKPRPGTIVLAHDGHASPGDGADPVTEPLLDRYELVSSILSAYAARGLTSRTLSEVIDTGTPVYRAQFTFHQRRSRDSYQARHGRDEGGQ